MKCLQHPDEEIRCINIDPEMHYNRFLCFDCYVEAIARGVPQSHLPKIQDVIQNPRLLFSLNLQSYQAFNEISYERDRYFPIIDEFDKIKQIIRSSYDQLLKQLDEYTDQIQQLWQGYDELHDYVWQYLKYPVAEVGLQQIISLENYDNDHYNVILNNVNSLFDKIHLNSNDEFTDHLEEITKFSEKIRNINIVSHWKSNLKPLKEALAIFMDHHQQIFCFQNKDNKVSREQLYEQISQLKYKCQPRKCAICMDYEAQYAATPCGHLSYCQNCKSKIFNQKQCAVCKQQVNSMYRIYNS